MTYNKQIHSTDDARRIAKKRLPWMVFDYIDGAAGDGYAENANFEALQQIELEPRILNNVENRDLSVDLFGKKVSLPFGISPMGFCNLADPKADIILAKSAAKHAIPHGVSTAATTSLEDIAKHANGNAWFQLYFSGNEDSSFELMDRAVDAGYETLVLTVDVPEVGRRPRELRRGFKVPFKIGISQFIDFAFHPRWSIKTALLGTPKLANFGGRFGDFDRSASRAGADWSLFSKIRKRWNGNLVVKGVLNVDDALKLKELGADAIQVSSHGSRQINSAPPPIQALARIRDAVGPDYPLFYDTGIRSGEDIVKAFAMGADFCFLGRPLSYAIASNGAKGLQQMVDVLADEVSLTLAQLGLQSMDRAKLKERIFNEKPNA